MKNKIVILLSGLSLFMLEARRVVSPRMRQKQEEAVDRYTEQIPSSHIQEHIEVPEPVPPKSERSNIEVAQNDTPLPVDETSLLVEEQSVDADIKRVPTPDPIPFGLNASNYQNAAILTMLEEMRAFQSIEPFKQAWNSGGGFNNPDRDFIREAFSVLLQIRRYMK